MKFSIFACEKNSKIILHGHIFIMIRFLFVKLFSDLYKGGLVGIWAPAHLGLK